MIFEPVTGADPRPASELDMYRSLRGDDVVAYERRLTLGAAPIVTALLMGIQIRLWWLGKIPNIGDTMRNELVVSAGRVFENAEVWRIFSAGLLHQDLDHIGGNLLMFGLTGWYLERALGRWNLALIFFSSVFVGYVFSIIGSPYSWSLGSSGGVFGMIAATVVAEFVRPGQLPRRGLSVFGVLLVLYMGLMFYGGLVREGVDNMAHLGGLLAGGALALVVQPDLLQVRPGHNRRVASSVIGGIALSLAVFGLAGPRITPLVGVEEARYEIALQKGRKAAGSSRPSGRRALQWAVPSGWVEDVDAVRSPVFASPRLGVPPGSPVEVGFGVRTNSRERLVTVEDLAESWRADLASLHPEATVVGPETVQVGDVAGLALTASVPGTSALRLEWRGAVRGIWTFQETWQVAEDRASWMQPLRDRLRGSVVWEEPEELAEARVEYDQFPNSPRAQRALAAALARAGQLEASLELHEALTSSEDVDASRWVAALESVHVGLDLVEDPERWWDRAMAATPSAEVVAQVVRSLVAAERESEARGLLELAWWKQPGERSLARLRRRQGLDNDLTSDGVPWRRIVRPDGTERPGILPNEGPLTMAAAARAGRQLDQERAEAVAQTVAAIRTDDPSVIARLLYFRDGYVPPLEDDLRQALADEVERAGGGRKARWMPDEVGTALAEQDPGGVVTASRVAERIRDLR